MSSGSRQAMTRVSSSVGSVLMLTRSEGGGGWQCRRRASSCSQSRMAASASAAGTFGTARSSVSAAITFAILRACVCVRCVPLSSWALYTVSAHD
eukprot:1548622-Prymnesium_polylepis.2